MIRGGDQNRLSFWTAGLGLALLGVLLLCYHLGKPGLTDHSRAVTAVQAMRLHPDGEQAGQVLAPGDLAAAFAPVYTRCVSLSARLSDSPVTAFHLRLPGAICAIAILLLTAWWLYTHIDAHGRDDESATSIEGYGLMAGMMLATTPLFLIVGRSGSSVLMLALAHLAASFCLGQSLEARRSFYAGRPWRSWALWGYVIAGVGMLAAGPIILVIVWIPYLFATRSYKMHGPDGVHLLGLLLALAAGIWWFIAQPFTAPGGASALWSAYLGAMFGRFGDDAPGAIRMLGMTALLALPWAIPALGMVTRVWRKADRSPTLVFWMWSLLGNGALLTLLALFGHDVRDGFILLLPFAVMLAADGFFRWNFESRWAYEWRGLMSVLAALIIVFGLGASTLLHSYLGGALFIGLGAVWAGSAFGGAATSVYRPRDRSVRVTVVAMLGLLALATTWLSECQQRCEYYDDTLNYLHAVSGRAPEKASEGGLYAYPNEDRVLLDYYLEQPVREACDWEYNKLLSDSNILPGSDAGVIAAIPPAYVFSREGLDSQLKNPLLVPITQLTRPGRETPERAMFRELKHEDLPTSATLMDRLAYRPPLRIALLGNSGTGKAEQRRVAKRLDKTIKKTPIDDILMLGNNLYGSRVYNHLGFVKRFENVYDRMLRRGIRFHAVLGHEDQGYAWFQMRYPLFRMNGQRYYKLPLGEGLADCFMLDSNNAADPLDGQMAWLDHELEQSQAAWKIVALHRALFSASGEARIDGELTTRLIPILRRHRVDLVCWAGGRWYERLQLPDTSAIFINAGWSGDDRRTSFDRDDERLRSAVDGRAGFALLEIRPLHLRFQAIDTDGKIVDEGEIIRPIE